MGMIPLWPRPPSSHKIISFYKRNPKIGCMIRPTIHQIIYCLIFNPTSLGTNYWMLRISSTFLLISFGTGDLFCLSFYQFNLLRLSYLATSPMIFVCVAIGVHIYTHTHTYIIHTQGSLIYTGCKTKIFFLPTNKFF